jgi:hypothetical protein
MKLRSAQETFSAVVTFESKHAAFNYQATPILIMSAPELTGLQKRASKYINKSISYQVRPGEVIEGYFSGFDQNSIDRAVIQMSNAADKTTLPLMTVVNYFEGVEDEEL